LEEKYGSVFSKLIPITEISDTLIDQSPFRFFGSKTEIPQSINQLIVNIAISLPFTIKSYCPLIFFKSPAI
jgi:hypothetical protein